MDSVLEMEKSRNVGGLGELPAFVSLPAKNFHELSADAQDVFKKIAAVRTNLVLMSVNAQSSDEFKNIRERTFADVVRTNEAMGGLAHVMVPAPALERLAWQAFAELEAELAEHGTRKFGESAKEQAIFTVWTLRKINRLLSKILERKQLEGEEAEKDREIAKEFSFFLFWTYFHLECLIAAMRFDRPIQIDVLDVICEGLRAVVNAYGLLRQGLNLRFPPAGEELLVAPIWDEEDDELLASSMEDLETMEIDEY
jgi:hypothetical protein